MQRCPLAGCLSEGGFALYASSATALMRAAREVGWLPIDGWPYGAEVGYPRALYLFEKGPQPAPQRI